jgi:hypothetical protein
MSFKKCFAQNKGNNKYLVHLWSDEGYQRTEWINQVFKECHEADSTHTGLNGEPLIKTSKWNREDPKLHFHDMPPYQKFLVEKYGTNDDPSITHKELFFDIEIEMGDALTEEYIKSAPKTVTSIAWYDKQVDEWAILILDAPPHRGPVAMRALCASIPNRVSHVRPPERIRPCLLPRQE